MYVCTYVCMYVCVCVCSSIVGSAMQAGMMRREGSISFFGVYYFFFLARIPCGVFPGLARRRGALSCKLGSFES
jgi:hypothetical protein